jgi:hypothetical protein
VTPAAERSNSFTPSVRSAVGDMLQEMPDWVVVIPRRRRGVNGPSSQTAMMARDLTERDLVIINPDGLRAIIY